MFIGQRCRHADTKQKGTIRFIGQINSKEYIGIEYDEPNTGKYDGLYEGVRYFTCPPLQGAFMKSNKLILADDLKTAIENKYLLDRKAEKVMHITDGQLEREMEFCGIEQVDRWHKEIQLMPVIGFPDSNVSNVSDYETIKKLVPNLMSLDLSNSLLTDIDIIQLFDYLPRLQELILSQNMVHLSNLSESVINQLKSRTLTSKLSMNRTNSSEQDLNILTRLPFVNQFEMNESRIDISKIQLNTSLVSLSLTGSLRFETVAKLSEFLKSFPNLDAFTALDSLNESFLTETPQVVPSCTKITELNLADSALAFDSLVYLRQMCPGMKRVKVLKLFHSKQSGQQSIFQSDQVLPIISGMFYKTIVSVNAIEARKQINDAVTYLLKYYLKLDGFRAKSNEFFIEMAKASKFQLPKCVCEGLSDEQMQELQIFEPEQIQTVSQQQQVAEKFHNRLIQILVPRMNLDFLIPKTMQVWKFKCMLEEKGFNVNEKTVMKFEGGREVVLEGVRFSSQLEEFREFVIEIE